jgi:hypothetical protein
MWNGCIWWYTGFPWLSILFFPTFNLFMYPSFKHFIFTFFVRELHDTGNMARLCPLPSFIVCHFFLFCFCTGLILFKTWCWYFGYNQSSGWSSWFPTWWISSPTSKESKIWKGRCQTNSLPAIIIAQCPTSLGYSLMLPFYAMNLFLLPKVAMPNCCPLQCGSCNYFKLL